MAEEPPRLPARASASRGGSVAAVALLALLVLPLGPIFWARGTLGPVMTPLLALVVPGGLFLLAWELVGRGSPELRRLELDAYLYLFPALLVLTVFHLLPVLYALRIAFYQSAAGDPLYLWVGLRNFERLLVDATFWHALTNTAWYAALTVLGSMALGLVVALLLHQKLAGLGAYRTLYFLPVVTSVAAVSLVWKLLFHPQRGVLNALLGGVGLPSLGWLQEGRGVFEMAFQWATGASYPGALPAGPSLALVSVALMSIWKSFGYNVVIYLAGLQDIPEDLYEAATIDGATPWQKFRMITWPMLGPTSFFILVMSTISSFQVFAQIFMLYGGNATETSRVIVYYLYEKAFQTFELGYASAIAFVLFLILFTLTILQRRLVGARVHYANAP